jgi:hypothetical protein
MASSGQDLIVHFVAVGIADSCVFFGWLAMMTIGVFAVRHWRASVLARSLGDEEDNLGALRWVVYGCSLVFWPAALVMGLVFLRKPATARVGATCFYLLFAYVSFCVVLAIALVTTAAVLWPELFIG